MSWGLQPAQFSILLKSSTFVFYQRHCHLNVDNFIKAQKILIAPLNWGLGHAARCIPIIKQHMIMGNEVAIASDGEALHFLKKEFPQLRFFQLPSYRITYSVNWFTLRFLFHLIYLKKVIAQEHAAIDEIVNNFKPDLIISDNRYGVFHSQCKSIIITHQLCFVLTGWKKIFSTTAAKIVAVLINKFDECQVPVPDLNKNLIPDLVKNKYIKIDMVAIGYLSRFASTFGITKTIDKVVLITGPEHYRTQFENEMIAQLNGYDGNGILIRSSKKNMQTKLTNPNVTVVDYATTAELQQWLARTKVLISRSGYSTVMDAMQFDCDCIFIPTPNQPEQLYIAQQWKYKKNNLVANQRAGERVW